MSALAKANAEDPGQIVERLSRPDHGDLIETSDSIARTVAVLVGEHEIGQARVLLTRFLDAARRGATREQHLLTVLAEECAEVAQRASKAIRFGIAEVQPGQDLDNKQRLEAELGDLLGMADMLGLTPDPVRRKAKPDRVERYMRYSAALGLVDQDT